MRLLGESVSDLREGDQAKYITTEEEASFNLNFQFSPASIEDLLIKEIIDHETPMILKVKKPDYLGESMWNFRFEKKMIQAKILDVARLKDFQNRKVEVRPGDGIKANVRVSVRYGYDGEVVAMHYFLLEVLEVIRSKSPGQNTLF